MCLLCAPRCAQESTYDVIHTSWTYHSGYPRVTLMEMYRVLRPGGFLSLNTWTVANKNDRGLVRIRAFAREMGWRLVYEWLNDTITQNGATTQHVIYQMPSYRYSGLRRR